MIKKYIQIICFAWLCLFAAACGEKETVYFETETSVSEIRDEEAADDSEIKTDPGKTDTQTVENASEKSVVYICGAVNAPGVYEVEQNARLYVVIEAAGGLTEDAAAESVNQAREVADGEMVRILTQEEVAQNGSDEMGNPQETGGESKMTESTDGKIDLNQATAAELMTLSGIGQAKAESIIRYREKNGAFSSIEEIKQVEGIKEGVYNRIKDDIKVK